MFRLLETIFRLNTEVCVCVYCIITVSKNGRDLVNIKLLIINKMLLKYENVIKCVNT